MKTTIFTIELEHDADRELIVKGLTEYCRLFGPSPNVNYNDDDRFMTMIKALQEQIDDLKLELYGFMKMQGGI